MRSQDNPTGRPHEHLAKSSWNAAILLGISALGVVALILSVIIDSYSQPVDRFLGTPLLGSLRDPMKRYIDENFLSYLAVVGPSVVIFVVSGCFTMMQAARRLAGGRFSSCSALRGLWCLGLLVLAVLGFYIGYVGPILLVLINTGSLRATVWSAPFVLAVLACAADFHCPPRHRTWLRPFAWGAVAGSLVQLVHLASIGWSVDLTV